MMSNWVNKLLVLAVVSTTTAAYAHESPGETIVPPPPTFEASGVTVDEQIGSIVPLDAQFQTIDGKPTTLGDQLERELPTIITFNYSNCPMLCNLQLNGLVKAMPSISGNGVELLVGKQFRVVTIGLDPTDTPEKLGKMRDRYIGQLPVEQQARAREGWTFLAAAKTGDGSQIARVAQAVGFKYAFIKDRAEWAHPAALIFLSNAGRVMRYVYGIEFPADVMRDSILSAGLAEPKAAAGYMLRCYHFDPSTKDHSRAGVLALRIGAAGFVVLLAGIGMIFLVRGRSRRSTGSSTEALRS